MQESASEFQVHGLLGTHWRGRHSALPRFHRHNEIELNLLSRGRMLYTIGGRSVAVTTRRLCVFWAGFSHRVSQWEHGEIWALAIPLTVFLSWPLPRDTFVYPLLHGELLYETEKVPWHDDLQLMQRWYADLEPTAKPYQREALLLEVQARLRRMAMNAATRPAVAEGGAEPARVARMLQFIAEHYREQELTVTDIARSADTNASYAMELFKQSCGVSLMQYVNDQRVAHARRLLATTDAKTIEVAMAAGFGSLSQFHNVFRRVCGQTPREYARAQRRGYPALPPPPAPR